MDSVGPFYCTNIIKGTDFASHMTKKCTGVLELKAVDEVDVYLQCPKCGKIYHEVMSKRGSEWWAVL